MGDLSQAVTSITLEINAAEKRSRFDFAVSRLPDGTLIHVVMTKALHQKHPDYWIGFSP
jgi:hypothetical protein